MRFKTVPEPPDDLAPLDAIEAVRDALPLVPRTEGDCCGRIADSVAWIEDRDAAREWLGFLRALDLVTRSPAGYARSRESIDSERVAERFRANLLGADAGIEALDDAPDDASLTVDDVFDAIESEVPGWERRRSDTWEATWRAHTGSLLTWATAFGLAERTAEGYRRR